MLRRAAPPVHGTGDVELVVQALRRSGPDRFGIQGTADVTAALVANRRRCALYRAVVSGSDVRHDVLIKMRRGVQLRPAGSADRPELGRPLPLTEQQRTQREFEGLLLAVRAAQGRDDVWSVTPHLVLPEQCALVMEWVAAPTLQTVLAASSRRARTRRRTGVEDAMHGAGRWLRAYHDAPSRLALDERLTSGAEVAALVERFSWYLPRLLGARPVFERVGRSCAVLAEHLPAQLATATGHGDFAPRNVFVESDSRVRVVDPMPLWRAPVHEDVARMLVSLRLSRLQLLSAGLAVPDEVVVGHEEAFLTGYFGDPARTVEVDAFCLLIALDHWTALVQHLLGGPTDRRAAGSVGAQLRSGVARAVSRSVSVEVTRLLEALGVP